MINSEIQWEPGLRGSRSGQRHIIGVVEVIVVGAAGVPQTSEIHDAGPNKTVVNALEGSRRDSGIQGTSACHFYLFLLL